MLDLVGEEADPGGDRVQGQDGDPKNRFWQRVQGSGVGDCPMWPVLVVMPLVPSKSPQEMRLVPDQRAVEQFPAARLDPASAVGVDDAIARILLTSLARAFRLALISTREWTLLISSIYGAAYSEVA